MGHKENREELDYYRARHSPPVEEARGGSHRRKHGGLWLVHEHEWNGRKSYSVVSVQVSERDARFWGGIFRVTVHGEPMPYDEAKRLARSMKQQLEASHA